MKTFRFAIPEPGERELPNGLKVIGTYFNAFVSLSLMIPYVGLCLVSITSFGGFYVLGMLWLFLVSPVLVVLQLMLCAKSVKQGTGVWKSHAWRLSLVALSYILLAIGLFGNDCAVSV